jgi:penicillin-binding protein 1A
VIRVIATGKDKAGKEQWSITQVPEVEGAFVSMDPRTGAIRSMVGGFDNSKSQFNRVTQAWRQPGSSFKPFIYSAGAREGLHAGHGGERRAAVLRCGHHRQPAVGAQELRRHFDGPMSLRRALAKSKNMVSIRILQGIGTGYAQNWVTRFGFDADKHLPYLPMALGTGSVTPLQMAAAYSVFANGGYRVSPGARDARHRQPRPHPQPDEPPAAHRGQPRDRRAQRLRDGQPAAGGRAQRHRGAAQATLKRPTSTARPAPPTIRWTPGSPASAQPGRRGLDRLRHAAQAGRRETGGGLALPVWIDYMRTR